MSVRSTQGGSRSKSTLPPMNLGAGLPLFEQQPPGALSVSELSTRIKGVLEPPLNNLWVKGEISNFRAPNASGHLYFSLKDSQSMISVAAFGWGNRSRAQSPQFQLHDGLEVLVHGRISVYGPRGTYQLAVDQIEPVGAGALQLAFEQLKSKLQREGLFEAQRKRPLPQFPTRIAVVTSPTGAAIKDLLQVLGRRAPQVQVTIVPALVQGPEAAAQIKAGLEIANAHQLGDVVVLARGGGSMEDLWCFNDESLARAISVSSLPVISAVGHEIDFTISDFVSDVRAPTPSAAAEMLSQGWMDSRTRLHQLSERLPLAMRRLLRDRRHHLVQVAGRLVNPRDRLREQSQRTDELAIRLEKAMQRRLELAQSRVSQLAVHLDALSPLRVLERGYTLVKDPLTGTLVKSAAGLETGRVLEIGFHDGSKKVQVQG